MSEEILHTIREEIRETIKTVVNGKIDKMDKKLDAQAEMNRQHNIKHEADMEEIKPMIQLLSGGKVLGNGIKWVAGVGIAYLAIRALFTGGPLP